MSVKYTMTNGKVYVSNGDEMDEEWINILNSKSRFLGITTPEGARLFINIDHLSEADTSNDADPYDANLNEIPLAPTASVIPDSFTPAELSEELGVSVHTLNTWRSRKKGPRFVRIAGRIHYMRTDVEQWINDEIKRNENKQ